MPQRTIAIGDIHGCSAALAALIDAIAPRPDDVLVTLGDYTSRGHERDVLELLELERHQRDQLSGMSG
jgi:serine/threonine protein phosphatase 1